MSMSREALERIIAEDQFGLLIERPKSPPASPEARLIAGFQDVCDFVQANGREPIRSPSDMSETKLAMRLEALRGNDEHRALLKSADPLGLLHDPEPPESLKEVLLSDSAGLLSEPVDIYEPRGRSPKTVTIPERIARRKKCEDFEKFAPLFTQCHRELRTGVRRIVPFRKEQQIRPDTYYVLKGVLVYVAGATERVREHGRINSRLRCIFENGTEGDLLLRSFSSQLYRFGKRITDPETALMDRLELSTDTPTASIYVLRSLSDDPTVHDLKNLHKIGSTKRTVEERTARADKRTTFLNAPVEIVAEYQVPAGTERKIEGMLHRIFANVRLDVWFDREGRTVAEAREWFAVPLGIIDEAIQLIENETVQNFKYDPDTESLVLIP